MADKTTEKKAMHINLTGAQVSDYEIVKAFTGITNDNDLIRHLLRKEATGIRGTFPLLDIATQARATERPPETDAQKKGV